MSNIEEILANLEKIEKVKSLVRKEVIKCSSKDIIHFAEKSGILYNDILYTIIDRIVEYNVEHQLDISELLNTIKERND